MKPLQLHRIVAFAVALVAAGANAGLAEDGELRLMRESIQYTNVADAFDEDDPFDLNVHVGYRRSRYTAPLQREINDPTSTAGRSTANQLNIGDYEHVRNILDIGVDLGVFRDVMLQVRLPLVLSDTRKIAGSAGQAVVSETNPINGANVPLFYLPFEAPTRSGIDRLHLGLAFSVLNQFRRPSFPTWMMLVETNLGLGRLMQPCDPSEAGNGVVRNAMGEPTGEPRSCNAGVSQGIHQLRFETRLSRRYRYAEVYSGLGYTFQWPGRAQELFTGAPPDHSTSGAGNLDGFKNVLPPMIGSLTGGVTLIPWEQRQRWQRLTIDLRANFTYLSEGRDYSPLYDALGSSQNAYLSEPALEGVPTDFDNNMVDDQVLRRVHFNGLTDVQARGIISGAVTVAIQAAKYVRFQFGTRIAYTSPYLITSTDACNASVSPGTNDPRRGRCISGIINPHHRAVIDVPGKRFRVGEGLNVDIQVGASAQF